MRKRFRIYIDESGDHTYKHLKHPANRYLGLIGCVFEFEKIEIFKRNLEEFKQKFLIYDPDLPPILHRNDIINRRGCFGRLCIPEVEKKFNNALLNLIEKTNFKIIAEVIDKKTHIEKYEEVEKYQGQVFGFQNYSGKSSI